MQEARKRQLLAETAADIREAVAPDDACETEEDEGRCFERHAFHYSVVTDDVITRVEADVEQLAEWIVETYRLDERGWPR